MHKSLSLSSLARVSVIIAAVSFVINAALAWIGKAVSAPPDTFGPYMYTNVVGLTVAGVCAGAIVYALMRRYIPDTARANRLFIILSVVALIISFYPDIALPWSPDPDDVGWTYGIIGNLMLMHVVPAGLVMRFFPRIS